MTGGRHLIIIGTGDHSAVVADLARACGRSVIGFVEPERTDEVKNLAASTEPTILGTLDAPEWLMGLGEVEFVVAIGDNAMRERAFAAAERLGLVAAALIHPSALVLGGARVGPGSQVCAAAVIGVEAEVLENSIVNTAATLDHHNHIGPHAFIGPGAHLAGRVTVEEGAHVGIGVIVREGSIIGRASYVAAGAVVIGPIGAGMRVAGIPARPMDDSRRSPEAG